MKIEDYNRLRTIAKRDLELNEKNFQSISLKIPSLYHKYLSIYTTQLKHVKNLIGKKEALFGELYDHFRFHYEYKLDKRSEIEPFINNHSKYIELCKQLNEQECIAKFFENILSQLKSIPFTIKNYIEFRKFMQGD